MKGKKYDDKKLPMDVIMDQFPLAFEAIAETSLYGHTKYELNGEWLNWKAVDNALFRYTQAKGRHWMEIKKGIEIDDESGLPHLYHYLWNAMAITQLTIEQCQYQKKEQN